MGLKTRGGLSRKAYRARRSGKAESNAKPNLNRDANQKIKAIYAEQALALPRPEHNTIHGTHTGPKDRGTTAVPTAPARGMVVISGAPRLSPQSVAGAATALAVSGALAAQADDGATPYQKPSVPRGRVQDDPKLARRIKGSRGRRRTI